ncbi:MAG TPA: hypothetical protein EYQ24_06730, partial [Bacteroidetes bacterium]|nr:hypothetical protein [Bacteroidota bacterium]
MRALLFLLVLASSTVAAQTPGSCEPGTAQGDLDVSNVFARVFNTGSLFYGNTTTAGDGYTVPKFSGNSPLFAAGLWIAGEVEGEVRSAGSRYSNFTFWPGPLGDGATLPAPDDCSAYDRIYVVSRGDVARYEGGEEPSADLAEWPVGLGAPAVTAGGAPVEPTSRDQVLDLGAGERPVLYGSQTAWWVMNDVGNEHTEQQTEPLGIEVRVSAFSVASREVAGVSESTFYRYEVLNRSANAIENARAGFFIDPDLGAALDDYVGSDSTRGMFFVYNAGDDDASYGTPPALGIDLLSGTGGAMYFEGATSGPTIDPVLGTEYYTYLQSRWKDGTPLYEFRDGYDEPMASITEWAFPGDPVAGAFWSEVNNDGNSTDNLGGDRRGLATAPEFDLAPGGTYTLDVGVLFAQGADRFDSITELRSVSDAVQAAYDDGSLFELGSEVSFLPAPVLLAPAASADLGVQTSVRFEWEPVSGADGYLLKWSDQPEGPFTDQVLAAEASISVPLQTLDLASGYSEVYWRVEAQSEAQYGLPSETRAFRVFRNGALSLPDGTPAYLEVQNAEGSALCETDSDDPGCALTGGRENAVYLSLNSTGTYYFAEQGTGSEPQLAFFGPKDFEIRFTDEGSLAGYLFQPPYNVI